MDLPIGGTIEQVFEQQIFREDHFPTTIFRAHLDDAKSLNDQLLLDIREERECDEKGIERSNFRKLGGWHSRNDLHKKEAFGRLVGEIHRTGRNISRRLEYHDDYVLSVDNMWAIINQPGGSNRAHIHPGSLWSGVYYVQGPENAGRIEFIDPRTSNLMRVARFRDKEKRPKPCWTKVRFQPTPGKILIFPSWLYHAVEPNESTEEGWAAERVIISFNMSQRKR